MPAATCRHAGSSQPLHPVLEASAPLMPSFKCQLQGPHRCRSSKLRDASWREGKPESAVDHARLIPSIHLRCQPTSDRIGSMVHDRKMRTSRSISFPTFKEQHAATGGYPCMLVSCSFAHQHTRRQLIPACLALSSNMLCSHSCAMRDADGQWLQSQIVVRQGVPCTC